MRDINKVRNNSRRSMKKNGEIRLSMGACLRCKIIRMKTSNQYCERHYFETVSKSVFKTVTKARFLEDLLIRQQYKCALTGDDIILGVNDSVDHIIPKSRIENYNDFSNIRWTTRQANTVKNNLTDEELIEFLEKVKSIAFVRKREAIACA